MDDERPLPVTLENRLMGQGIYLESWERDGDGAETTVVLEYETVTEASTVTSDEVGTVVRTLLEAVDERGGWTPVSLVARSYATDGRYRGVWRVEAEWFRRLGDDLTEVEFSHHVLDTIREGTHEER